MKKKLLCIFLLVCVLLAGCAGAAEPTTQPITEDTTPTAPDPIAVYEEAAEAINQIAFMELDISKKKAITIGEETYRESSIQTLIYKNAGTDSFVAANTEILSLDGYSILIQESYADGTAYYTVDKNNFKGEMDADSFLSRFAPAVLIDPALYKDVEIKETADGCTYIFSNATDAEIWLMLEGVEFVAASGEATLDADSNLISNSYTVTYTYGGAQITQTFTASLDDSPVSQIQLPENPEEYTSLAYPDLPRLLELACGYIRQTSLISADITQTYMSQAGGIYLGQSHGIDLFGKDSDLRVKSDYDITVMDLSRGSNTDTYAQTEQYSEGTYTLTEDGKVTTQSSDLSPKDMRNYIINQLLENVALPKFLSDCDAVDLGGICLFTFTCNEKMALLMQDVAANALFNDTNALNFMADSYETTEMTGYLGIDKYTGLPTAVGFMYSGNHIIDEQPYALSYQVDQSLRLGSLTAQEEITGEIPAVPHGTPQPTPLFYHVTGSDGEEMWLLGTIHVGDIRTSNLPAAIYDALEHSDALAVEFDMQSFEAQAEKDEALQSLLADAYFYGDGSMLADHIDPELYDYVIALLKASGNYHQNIPYCKPFALDSAISNFYLSQANLLTSENGVDNRLLSYAKENGKQIMDVESGAFQLSMLSGYSDKLQEALLASTAAADSTEYWRSVCDLYEMWCAGDIEGIRAELQTDTSEMTEEELALYEEYNGAMNDDRNKKMLDVAIEYLEGDETVFYAVGLAHLIGEGGLVDTLAEAGYAVELVTYE